MPSKQVDVALSFAGEQRDIAKSIRTELESLKISVFYDEDQKSNLWGVDLFSYLTEVYHTEAKFCVILVSADYKKKRWTVLERRAAQARAFSQGREYILPVRIDDTELEGLLPTVGYLSWKDENAASIAKAIQQKLGRQKRAKGLKFSGKSKVGATEQAIQPSIDSFQERLSLIFKHTNKNLTLEYMYGYLARTSAYLSKRAIQGTCTVKILFGHFPGSAHFRPSWECASRRLLLRDFPKGVRVADSASAFVFTLGKNHQKISPHTGSRRTWSLDWLRFLSPTRSSASTGQQKLSLRFIPPTRYFGVVWVQRCILLSCRKRLARSTSRWSR